MLARIVKTTVAFLLFSVVALAVLWGWSKHQANQFEEAVAQAEDWNRSHWENGTALRIVAHMNARIFRDSFERETTLDCFQKRLVDREGSRRPVTRTVSRAVGLKALFAITSEERSYYVGPADRLCDELFQDDVPTNLPAHFEGDIVINEIPTDENADILHLNARLGPTCKLLWATGQPVNLGNNVSIEAVEIRSVEVLPLSDVVSSPENMGTANAIMTRLFRTSVGADPNLPAHFQWNTAEKCWVGRFTGECNTDADDSCGIPKL